jgi:hypothetical protein
MEGTFPAASRRQTRVELMSSSTSIESRRETDMKRTFVFVAILSGVAAATTASWNIVPSANRGTVTNLLSAS